MEYLTDQISRRSFCVSALTAAAMPKVLAVVAGASTPIPVYEPADMQYDLSWLRETLLDVAVDPFAYSSAQAFERAYDAALTQSSAPADAFTFGLRAMRVFATLNDAHCGIDFFPALSKVREAGLIGFPLDFYVLGERMFVGAQGDPRFPSGTEYISINGISVPRLIELGLPYVGAQNRNLALMIVNVGILSFLYASYPGAPAFDVAFRKGGNIVEATIRATTFSERTAAQRRFLEPSQAAMRRVFGVGQPYSFMRIGGGRIGYIDYRACVDEPRFKSFLESTFSSIKQQPVDAVIVDVRHNGGGDDDLNVDLWDYLTDKPFTQFGAMVIKVSDLLKKQYGKIKYQQIYTEKAWDSRDGLLLTVTFVPQFPRDNPLRFSGPVYVLMGRSTFSSAMECALIAKDFGLATLVGEETGEPVNSSGELYTGLSPRTGLSFHFPTKFFYGYKPRPMGQGVLPDVPIATILTPDSKADLALDWIISQVRHHKTAG